MVGPEGIVASTRYRPRADLAIATRACRAGEINEATGVVGDAGVACGARVVKDQGAAVDDGGIAGAAAVIERQQIVVVMLAPPAVLVS